MRPRLLDLFCGAGGAAKGYADAGFHVTGVDIVDQPRYAGDVFIQREAMTFLSEVLAGAHGDFDAIHASPPCQAYSATRTLHDREYPRLIHELQLMLLYTGPYVIENVVGAPLHNPVMLCGSSFGLGVRRHRLFECSFPVMAPPCAHPWQPEPIDVTGTGARRVEKRADGGGGNSRKPRNLEEARRAMGIHWMTRPELSEAIPPAFTSFIGTALMAHLTTSLSEGKE